MTVNNTDSSFINKIYQMKTLNDFALGLVSVFIPVYLLDLGFSLVSLFSWYLVMFTTFIFAVFASVYSTNKIGFVNTFYIRFLFLITHLGLLLTLPSHPQLFFIIASLVGCEWAFFWIPLNVLLVRNTTREKTGTALSKFTAYPAFLTMFSPLIGALVIGKFGFPTLFIAAMVLIIFAILFLLPLRSERTDFKFTKYHAREIFKNYKPFFKTEIVARLAEDTGMIWSILVYITLSNKLDVGIVGTISGVASILFVLTIGKLTDEWDKHKLIKYGAVSICFVWLIAYSIGTLSSNAWLYYIATIAIGFALKTFLIPYRTLLWNSGRKDDAQFIVLREIPSYLGRVVLFSLAIVFHKHLAAFFLAVSVIFLYFVFLNTRKLETT